MCRRECEILTKYGEQLEFLDNKWIFFSIYYAISVAIGLVYYFLTQRSDWWYASMPVLWGISWYLERRTRKDIMLMWNSGYELALFIITLPTFALIYSILIPIEKYIDKYGPHSRSWENEGKQAYYINLGEKE